MTLIRNALAIAAVLCAAAAYATPPSMDSAVAPSAKAARTEAFRAGAAFAARVRLPAPDAAAISALKASNARARHKRIDIGIGRELEAAHAGDAQAHWVAVAGGYAARWQVTSEQARALRVALRAADVPQGLELRFAGSAQPELVYGPFGAADVRMAGASYWSPVLEGDTATVEAFLPASSGLAEISIGGLSHLFVSPADPRAESVAKAAGPCEVNLICRSATDPVLADAGRSVARMLFVTETGGSSMCTGTLLNPAGGSLTPYFYSAAHCFSTQSSARTVATYWFYETASCTGTTLNPAAIQVPGGSVLLYANEDTDVLFLRLNSPPPAGAVYAGWDAARVARNEPVTAIHHPDGDVKKVSLGAIVGFDTYPGTLGSFIRVQWNSLATGVTEPGSSGSAIFTATGSGLRVRGGLLGGESNCSAPTAQLFDVYSRFDLAFPFIAQHLSPGAAPALGPNALSNPGFEGGFAAWTQTSNAGPSVITNDPTAARSGSWYAWLGGSDSVTESIYQPLAIPPGPARLQFWYRVSSTEATATQRFDVLTVSIANASTGATLQSLGTLSNLDANTDWVQSPVYDVSEFGGQTVRVQLRATTDASAPTSFRVDDLTLNGAPAASTDNHTALWWNASESGWGINVTHQGDIAFATLFTYTSTGGPMWLVMPAGARKGGATTFMGPLYRTTGPPFNAAPFTPLGPGNVTEVGSMTVDFHGNGTLLGYTFNDTYVSKAIEKQVYGAAAASCVGTAGNRAGAANYQDLWWNPAESGWGINLTHQGDVIFGTLFTYAASGQGLWLVMPAGRRQSDGSFTGELYRTTGPAFNAVPFTPIGAGNITQVGTMRLRFQGGETGTLEYTVDGVSVTKSITRQVFGTPAPLCNG